MLRVLYTTIITLLSLSLFAQSHTKQEGIESNLRSIDSLLVHKNAIQSLYITPELTTIDVEDINNWAADLQQSEFSKSGLDVSLSYDYRFWNDDFVDDDYDGDESVPYKHRFLLSLKWNIMQSGLIGRDNFREKVDILSRTKSQEVVNKAIKYFVIGSAEQQITELYGYYNVMIDAKAQLYNALISMQDELSSNNRATMLSLSDLKIKRSNVLRMYKANAVAANGIIDLESYITSQHLFEKNEYDSLIENNNAILQSKLQQELNLNEVNSISYWKEIKVSPFLRTYNYIDEQSNSKYAGKVGVTTSFPIFTNTESKRSEVISRGKLLANEELQIRRNISVQVAELLQQLNENFITLQVLVESTKHYTESCKLATQYYHNNTMTIHELSQRYIDNLDNNIEIYRLIIDREKIKQNLFKVIYGV